MSKNERDFFLFGVRTIISKKEYVEFIIFLLIVLIPSIFIGGFSIFVCIICLLILMIPIISIHSKFDKQKNLTGHMVFWHHGIFSACLSFAFWLLGVRLWLLIVATKFYIVVFGVSILLVIILLYVYMKIIKSMIKKGKFSNVKIILGGFSGAVASLFGMSVARSVTPSMNNMEAIRFLSICCFILMSVMLFGVLNIYKYYHVVNNPELMETITKIINNKNVVYK